MTPLEQPDEVDLLVVGGGKAGKSLAMDRAKAGWSVAMVERDKIGGTCINVACIPTKSLVGSARTLQAARHAQAMGIEIDGTTAVSLDELRRHKESVVGGMVDAHRQMFADSGMDFILGTATFVAPRTVRIDVNDGGSRLVRGRDVVINTGTTPAVPPVPGIDEADVWTSETILRLDRLPQRLLILGGGYIGCEFASMMALLDVEVVLLQAGAQLVAREDADVAEALTEVLRGQGVDVRLDAQVAAVTRENDQTTVTLGDGSTVTGDELLVATGRAPVTADLGLDAAGVDLDQRGFVVVDDQLRTSAEHTWAAGDVAGSPQFTHVSWHDFRVLRSLLTGHDATTAGRLVPYTVFTTPELARVGMTEAEAREAGHDLRVATIQEAAIPRAKTLHDRTGVWKAVVDAGTDRILGAALLGHDAGEVISTVQMAMLGDLPYQHVRDAVITHPTMGEGLNLLFDTLGAEPHG